VEAALAGADGAVNAISLYVEQEVTRFTRCTWKRPQIARARGRQGLAVVHISGIGANTASSSTIFAAAAKGGGRADRISGAVIVRPAVLFAADDVFLTTILGWLRSLPAYPIFGDGRTRLQPVHADNVAAAIAQICGRARNRILSTNWPARASTPTRSCANHCSYRTIAASVNADTFALWDALAVLLRAAAAATHPQSGRTYADRHYGLRKAAGFAHLDFAAIARR